MLSTRSWDLCWGSSTTPRTVMTGWTPRLRWFGCAPCLRRFVQVLWLPRGFSIRIVTLLYADPSGAELYAERSSRPQHHSDRARQHGLTTAPGMEELLHRHLKTGCCSFTYAMSSTSTHGIQIFEYNSNTVILKHRIQIIIKLHDEITVS